LAGGPGVARRFGQNGARSVNPMTEIHLGNHKARKAINAKNP
jgi:hypothetical protein